MLLAAALALIAANASAVARPNFAGTWVRETPQSAAPGLVGWGWDPTITQTATTITVKWLAGRDNLRRNVYFSRSYNLTGESRNPVIGRGGVPTQELIVTVSTWQGEKLVLTTGQVKEVIWIENGQLVFERTISGTGGKTTPTTTKIVYKRKS